MKVSFYWFLVFLLVWSNIKSTPMVYSESNLQGPKAKAHPKNNPPKICFEIHGFIMNHEEHYGLMDSEKGVSYWLKNYDQFQEELESASEVVLWVELDSNDEKAAVFTSTVMIKRIEAVAFGMVPFKEGQI